MGVRTKEGRGLCRGPAGWPAVWTKGLAVKVKVEADLRDIFEVVNIMPSLPCPNNEYPLFF